MDLSQKRRGFMKVKVPSFGSRVSKVKPSNGQYNTASADYLVKQDAVSFVVPISADEGHYDSRNRDTYFGAMADEYVNMKASNYISSVKERFRIETLNCERRASQEITS